MIVFLVGFMGSGKSSKGKLLATHLGYDFMDTDKEIVEQLGMSINDIFRKFGEVKFRESETSLLNDLVTRNNLVVSTGGGLPCHAGNMDHINRLGCSIYLKVSPTQLFSRLSSRKYKRPLIKDLSDKELMDFIERTLSEREAYYEKARHVLMGLEVSIDELVNLVRD
ncbi:shikimate kinase [Bacteroidota bacterium]